MRKCAVIVTVLSLVVLFTMPRTKAAAVAQQEVSADVAAQRAQLPVQAARSEDALRRFMQKVAPVVDGYFQQQVPHDLLRTTPVSDDYVAARLRLPTFELLAAAGPTFSRLSRVSAGLADLLGPDWTAFDASRYDFSFVAAGFTSDIKTVMYDVRPRIDRDGFRGQIWIDEKDLAIVRYSGTSGRVDAALSELFKRKIKVHFDGWRWNIRPSIWVPALVSLEQVAPHVDGAPRVVGQIKVWNYAVDRLPRRAENVEMRVSQPEVGVQEAASRQPSQLEGKHQWQHDTVGRFVDHLTDAGLAGADGRVERICAQVAANLIAGGRLPLQPVECRILLQTAPLQAIPLEGTILIARSLLDLLPDESAIAMAVAHALAHMTLADAVDAAVLLAPRTDAELLRDLESHYLARREDAVDRRTVEILERSIYKDSLLAAGGFLDKLAATAAKLPALVGRFPMHADSTQALRQSPLMLRRPVDCDAKGALCALPIGARLFVNPLTNQLDLLRITRADDPREKDALAVTALFPHLTYVESSPATTAKAAQQER